MLMVISLITKINVRFTVKIITLASILTLTYVLKKKATIDQSLAEQIQEKQITPWHKE